jgi:hypothetical protein
MKPDIENLKVWMSGRSTTGYQRALGMREFEKLLDYVAELEQLRQPPVVGRSEQLVCDLCNEDGWIVEHKGDVIERRLCKCDKAN